MKKRIIGFMSHMGDYFVIWKDEDGYHLKNRFTEIPNKLNKYNIEQVKDFYKGLIERISECEVVRSEHQICHPNCCITVMYSDMSMEVLKEKREENCRLRSYIPDIANYSEFYQGGVLGHANELISLEHLRAVCFKKKERSSNILKILQDFIEDDFIDVIQKRKKDGTIQFLVKIYGIIHSGHPIAEILPNGTIGKTRDYSFFELMKEHNVIVHYSRK